MKSTIRIDFIDRGTGKGIEPVIKVEIIKSEDPRDTLVSALFQSLREQEFLQLHYTNHQHVLSAGNLPDMEKTVLLFKPEIDTDELHSIVRYYFSIWLGEEKYVRFNEIFTRGDNQFTEMELFAEFMSKKSTFLIKHRTFQDV